MAYLYRRRTFLQLMAAGGTAMAVPWLPGCSDSSSGGVSAPAHFFTGEERAVVEQLAAAIVPDDGQSVGALGTDAVEYIDRFLAIFATDVPTIYRGGPFSGRTPFPDPETGAASSHFPDDDYLEIVPPTRIQELSFRILLLGSASVPNGAINDPIVPSTPGLQAMYRSSIGTLNDFARQQGAASFAELDDDAKLDAFNATEPAFRDAFLEHLAEGMFGAPEYGGNRDTAGWRDYFFDGDSQPLGHTLYDESSETFYDRPDQPNQTLDPNRPNDGLEPVVESFVTAVALSQGGKRFF